MAGSVDYYTSPNGESDVQEFLQGLGIKARTKCLAYIDLLIEPGPPLPRSYAAHVRGRIWEPRPEYGGTEYRLLYAQVAARRFVILVGLKKDRQRLREEDITRAENRLSDYEQRNLP